MKNLKTVFLFVASLFLFFSCANDFGEGSAYVRIDPSIFSRADIENSSTNAYSYEVAIMGESMEPIWKTGTSSASVTLEFPDLPVGEKVFVYARLTNDPSDQSCYYACSDDFVIKRGVQPVKLKLRGLFLESGSTTLKDPDPCFDCTSGDTNARPLVLSWPTSTYDSNLHTRVSFTISNGTTSSKCIYYADSAISSVSLKCNKNNIYTISNLKVDYFGFKTPSNVVGAAPSADSPSWIYRVHESSDSIAFWFPSWASVTDEFEPIRNFTL